MTRIALVLLLVACKGDKPPPPAPTSGAAPAIASGSAPATVADAPSRALVEGIKGLCATEDMNPAEAATAMSDWTAKLAETQNREFADAYLSMMDGDATAHARLRAAADVAVGPGRCKTLDTMATRGRERAAQIAAMPAPGPASQALVDNMKFYCKGIEAMADMNPGVIQELTVLVEKAEYDKLRDAVKRAGLKDCPTLDAIIENQRARKGSAP